MADNPTLTSFEERFNEIIQEYNKEKDKNTIEATFEALMRLATEMEEESQSHVALGLTADQKPVFDLLFRKDLSKDEIKQIKSASIAILTTIRRRMEEVNDIFDKQSTRAGLRQEIYDILYDDRTGLPVTKYNEAELESRTDNLFVFFEQRHQRNYALPQAF